MIAKRSALIEAGAFIPRLKWLCDSFSQSVMSFRYGFCYIPEVMAVFRLHSGQFAGSSHDNWEKEREVILEMLELLKTPEYSDVIGKFKRTARFSDSSWEAMKVVISNKEYRDFFSMALLRSAIGNGVRLALKKLLPLALANHARRLDNNIRQLTNRNLWRNDR